MASDHRHNHAPAADTPNHGHVIRWAPSYDLVVSLLTLGRSRLVRERTVDLANLRPGETVLEVGCGTGAVARAARIRVGPAGHVLGIDPSYEMIAVARRKAVRKRAQINFRVAGIEALPFADASVDAALSSLMMHHLPVDLKRTGLAEVRRVLKPGGRLVIVDFGKQRGLLSHLALSAIVHHSSEHTVEDLVPLLEQAGFSDFRTGEIGILSLGFVTAAVASE